MAKKDNSGPSEETDADEENQYPRHLCTQKVGSRGDRILLAIDPIPPVIKVEKFEKVIIEEKDKQATVRRVIKEGAQHIRPDFEHVIVVEVETFAQIKKAAEDFEASHVILGTKLSLFSDQVMKVKDQLPLVNKSRFDTDDLREWRANPFQIGGRTYYATLPWKQVLYHHTNPFMINLTGILVEDLSRILKPLPPLPVLDMERHHEWMTLIETPEQWEDFYAELVQQHDKPIAFDTETRNLERVSGNAMLTAQFSWDGQHCYVISCEHRQSKFSPEYLEKIRNDLRVWMERGKSAYLVGLNLVFDIHVLRQFSGAKYVKHQLFDLMAARYLLDENSQQADRMHTGMVPGIYTLGGQALQFGSFAYMDSPIGKQERSRMETFDILDIAIYGGIDGIIPWHLANRFIELGRRQGMKDYLNLMLNLAGASLLVFAEMEHNGIYVDLPYLWDMMEPDSPLNTAIKEAQKKLYSDSTVIEVNKEMAYAKGYRDTQGFFGEVSIPWVFDVEKPAHRQKLFIEKMKLKPLSFTEKGAPQIDDAFIKHHSSSLVCRLYGELKQRNKVYGTNIVSFRDIVEASHDSRVRCRYGFINVRTMRSSSTSPNLQNIPNHGPYAKPIKRQFVAPEGKILLSYDLNANEVKNFGNIAEDTAITDAFGIGMFLRRRLQLFSYEHPQDYQEIHDTLVPFAKGDPEDSADIGKCYTKADDDVKSRLEGKYPEIMTLIKRLAFEGDIHRMNVQRFLGIPAQNVTKDQRQAIKAVVFGSLYGLGPLRLSQGIWKDKWLPYIYMTRAEQKECKEAVKLINDAKELQAAMWRGWSDARKYVDAIEAEARSKLKAKTALGTYRHLWGFLSPYNGIQSQQVRQAGNSMIQGPSSCINTLAGRICHTLFHQLRRAGVDLGFMNNNSVHDANYFEGILLTLPLAMYYITHAATDLTAEYCRKHFGWDMTADPEIDFTVGLTQTEQLHLNWTRPNMEDALKSLGADEDLIQDVLHNFDIVAEVRANELREAGERIGGYCLMSMKPRQVPEMGFILP